MKLKYLLVITIIAAVAALITCTPDRAAASTGTFTVGSNICTVDGVQIVMDVSPYEKNGRTYLPVRYAAYAVGIPDQNITWQPDTQTVSLSRSDHKTARLQLGSNLLVTSSRIITMDVRPEESNGRVFLPIAFIVQAFAHQASWDQASQTVTIFPQADQTPPASGEPEDLFTIIDPYTDVDWTRYGQFKASFHSHSTESGASNTPAAMIENHYKKGYDIMALTDHNFVSTTWDRTDRPAAQVYLTPKRLAEINAGVGRGGQGMIGIPFCNEQSTAPDLNTFWANFNNAARDSLESKIARAQSLGGLSYINHPGRYTGGDNTANGGADGAAASSQPQTISYYINLFNKYSSCLGMEIIKSSDVETFSDRILWDNILKQTMPQRPVWGFASDDAHSVDEVGFSYNVLLMPANNLDNVRRAMETGSFYAVARKAQRELGSRFTGSGPYPSITKITVDEAADLITIAGTNYNRIEWVADGQVIATGNSIDLDDYEHLLGTYVRAQLEGDGGICFTQPFGLLPSLSR